jgi:para-nitrobenzyl esterase
VAALLTLGLLAPLVAEYFLGDLRITNLAALPILVCTYGCGAVLLRGKALAGSGKVAADVQKRLRELLGARQIRPNGLPLASKNIDAGDFANRVVAQFWQVNPGKFSRAPKAQGDLVRQDSSRLRALPVSPLAPLLLAIACFSQVSLCAAQMENQPGEFLVRTTSGPLRGVARPDGGAEFLGIPYAQPPVGDLRWHEPLPVKPWSEVRTANSFGAPCAQLAMGDWNRRDAEAGKEDCLFLNVMTPVWPARQPLPVMLYLHGGANEGASASSVFYKDGTLIRHGVLLVTVNYRLGVFGFFAHPALSAESTHHGSGNYGLMDQILALRWVRENIANFGGDPGNITVFGNSAGAIDTGLLMTSGLSKDLFQRAIAESGTSFSHPLAPLAAAERAGEAFAAGLKLPAGEEGLKQLRQLTAQQLLASLSSQSPRPHFLPDIDGWAIARQPASVFAAGEEAAIPLLFGTTTRELGAAIYGTPTAQDALRKTIANFFGGLAPRALAAYGLAEGVQAGDDPLYGSPADQWAADLILRCPATAQGGWHNAAHHPTYEYEFAHAIPGQEAQGAVHGSELPYVFGYYRKGSNIAGSFADVDIQLSGLVENYWTDFAKTGNPNSAGLPEWPQFGIERKFIRFQQDGKVVPLASLRDSACGVYRASLAAHTPSSRD